MVYEISERTRLNAEQLGVQVFPSDNPKYKIEVYDFYGNFITCCGAAGYKDYPAYLEMEALGKIPLGTACKRKSLYWKRHEKEIEQLRDDWEGSKSYYAMLLLWS